MKLATQLRGALSGHSSLRIINIELLFRIDRFQKLFNFNKSKCLHFRGWFVLLYYLIFGGMQEKVGAAGIEPAS